MKNLRNPSIRAAGIGLFTLTLTALGAQPEGAIAADETTCSGIQPERSHGLQFVDPLWTPPLTTGMSLIPAGEFMMGDHHDGMSDALPVHSVYTDAFYMDVYEVTNRSYATALNWAWTQGLIQVTSGVVHKSGDAGTPYCDTTESSFFSRITWDGSDFGVTPGKEWHPMTMVHWHGAAAYANWRSGMKGLDPSYNTFFWTCNFSANGYRLPTEAEWEKAARGGEQDPYYRFSWGDTIDGSQANYLGSGDPYETTLVQTTPVGYYDGSQVPSGTDMANGYGLYDMVGNVVEWCNDWYHTAYYSSSPYDNPTGPATGSDRVNRGGTWLFEVDDLRCAFRYYGYYPEINYIFGFRLVLDVN